MEYTVVITAKIEAKSLDELKEMIENETPPYILEMCFDMGVEVVSERATAWKLEPDEHMPTKDGVYQHLDRQNDIAFLTYRRFSQNTRGMREDVHRRLEEQFYAWWMGVGDARAIAGAVEPVEEARKQHWYKQPNRMLSASM